MAQRGKKGQKSQKKKVNAISDRLIERVPFIKSAASDELCWNLKAQAEKGPFFFLFVPLPKYREERQVNKHTLSRYTFVFHFPAAFFSWSRSYVRVTVSLGMSIFSSWENIRTAANNSLARFLEWRSVRTWHIPRVILSTAFSRKASLYAKWKNEGTVRLLFSFFLDSGINIYVGWMEMDERTSGKKESIHL